MAKNEIRARLEAVASQRKDKNSNVEMTAQREETEKDAVSSGKLDYLC